MKKLHLSIALFAFMAITTLAQAADYFTKGNLVIMRVDTDNGGKADNAVAMYLDEYTTDGVFVKTLALPTASNPNTGDRGITARWNLNEGGFMGLSDNGKYLAIPGFNADAGTDLSNTTAANVNRLIAIVDNEGNISVKTGVTNMSDANSIRSAVVSDDGTQVWASGGGADGVGGTYYIPTGTIDEGTLLHDGYGNMRSTKIFKGQLYTLFNHRAYTLGTGLPTIKEGMTAIAKGMNGSDDWGGEIGASGDRDANEIAFLDMDPTNPDNKKWVAYITFGKFGRVYKISYIKEDDKWVPNGVIDDACAAAKGGAADRSYVRSIAARLGSTGKAELFLIAGKATWANNALFKMVDDAGHNSDISTTEEELVALAAGKTFRTLAWAPSEPTTSNVENIQTDQTQLVEVYNIMGVCIQTTITNTPEAIINNLPKGQVYIIKAGNMLTKVIL